MSKSRTVDLSAPVLNIVGDPIIEKAKFHFTEDPVDVEVGGRKFEEVTCIITKGEPLTFKAAIQKALLSEMDERKKDVYSKHQRSILALKLTEKDKWMFTSTQIEVIKISAREASPPIEYARIVELLDPVDAGLVDEEEE